MSRNETPRPGATQAASVKIQQRRGFSPGAAIAPRRAQNGDPSLSVFQVK
jgi:hypothetical protein